MVDRAFSLIDLIDHAIIEPYGVYGAFRTDQLSGRGDGNTDHPFDSSVLNKNIFYFFCFHVHLGNIYHDILKFGIELSFLKGHVHIGSCKFKGLLLKGQLSPGDSGNGDHGGQHHTGQGKNQYRR